MDAVKEKMKWVDLPGIQGKEARHGAVLETVKPKGSDLLGKRKSACIWRKPEVWR